MAHAADDGGGDVAFSADGNLAALAVGRRLVRLIDTRSWREAATLTPPRPQQFTGLAFSADGAHFAAGSLDHHVLVWDLAAIRRELAAAGLQ